MDSATRFVSLKRKFPNKEEDFNQSAALQARLHHEPLLPHLGLQRLLLLEQQPILHPQGHLLSLSPPLFTLAALTLLSNIVLSTIKFITQDHSGAQVSAVRSEVESEVLSLLLLSSL